MTGAISHRELEDFLYQEADLLDEWRLDEWVQLFTDECSYLVPSTDVSPDASPAENLFYVADNRHRLEQRVIRLMKKTAHAEYPRSRTRHLISNIRVRGEDGGHTMATCNFATYRARRGVTDTYIGHHRYRLVREGALVKIQEKRSILSQEGLRPHGRISMIV
jgi:p-cumate 2,3-dioxygenase subunit beta